MVGIVMRFFLVGVVLSAACAKVEHGQVQAVQDGTRVLGLVANSDGTYEFKLCTKLDAYPDEVLADTDKCINPLMNADGSVKVFSSLPETPSTAGVRALDWTIALLVASVVGGTSYFVARYMVTNRVIKQLARKKYVVGLENSYDATLKRLDDSEAKAMKEKWKELRIMEQVDDSWKIEGKLRDHILSGKKLKHFRRDVDEVENKLIDLDMELKSGERYAARLEEGINEMLKEAKKPDKFDEDRIKELQQKNLIFGSIRGYVEENRHLADVQLPAPVNEYLKDMTLPDYLKQLDDEISTFLTKQVADSADNLKLFTSEELRVRKENLETAVEGFKKFELSALNQEEVDIVKEVIKKVKDLIEKYPVVDERSNIKTALTKAKQRLENVDEDSRYAFGQELIDGIRGEMKADLKRVTKRLRKRGTDEGSPEKIIEGYGGAVRGLVTNTAYAKTDSKRRLANIGDKGDDASDGSSTSYWGRVKEIFNYGLFGRDKKVVVDEDKVVEALANGQDVRIIDFKRRRDKLVGHLSGVLTFIGATSSPDGSRKLPGNNKIAVAKRWHDLTSDEYSASATQVEDLRQLIDGLAEVSGTRVSPEVFYFLLRDSDPKEINSVKE